MGLPLPGLVAEARLAPSTVVVLGEAAPMAIDPASTFEVRVAAPLQAVRLVLLDAQDAVVPSTAVSEVSDTSRLTLAPDEPLAPGSRYLLRLEGVESRLIPARDGRTFEPAALPLTTSGEPPPKPPPRKTGRKRSRG